MLVLPVDEDAWVFRLCLYVGMALLLLDVALPRLFRRRVRLVMPPPPRVLPPLPRARVMEKAQFRRRKRELEREIRALERGDGAHDTLSAVETTSEREEEENERVRRRNEERQAARDAKKRGVKATRKRASRVVMPGDREDEEQKENDVYVPSVTQSASRSASRSASKRVSFDMTQSESGDGQREARQASPHEEPKRSASPALERSASNARFEAEENFAGASASVTETTRPSPAQPSPVAASTSDAPPAKPTTRPDPFSLVDDDFPWQLPNYGAMSMNAAPTALQPTQPTQPTSQLQQPSVTLNVRRPFGQFNGASASSTAFSSTLTAASSLELKHKPLWKRPSRETLEDTGAAASAGAVPLSEQVLQSAPTTTTAMHQQTNRYESSLDTQIPQRVSQPSAPFQKWRMASPKPPRPPRQLQPSVAHRTTASAADTTPVAPQSRLRTPKIIRRITFDEDMMGALATPSDASPFVTDSTRKRQRDQDVLDALDAVGLPWHKRRLNSGD